MGFEEKEAQIKKKVDIMSGDLGLGIFFNFCYGSFVRGLFCTNPSEPS